MPGVSEIYMNFYQTTKGSYKMQTLYLIALEFCSQKGGIEVQLGTKFGCNAINKNDVMSTG